MNNPYEVPYGLMDLHMHCQQVHPGQNPFKIEAVKRIWCGGPDPLDMIHIYSHPGKPDVVEPHWHYISFGLSDLYGYGAFSQFLPPNYPRLYPVQENSAERISGYGFELTFRLVKNEDTPPAWPATVMQALAKYVFQSKNTFRAGDHVSWHCSLDNSDSQIQHMLMTQDPELGKANTRFGRVSYIQIVGVCPAELKAAQEWNGGGVIGLMADLPLAGGPYLITDMRRGESIFDLNPDARLFVEDGISADGSNLSGVSANCKWSEKEPEWLFKDDSSDDSDTDAYTERAELIARGLNSSSAATYNYRSSNGRKSNCRSLNASRNASRSNSRSDLPLRASSAMSVSHDLTVRNQSRMSYMSETGDAEGGELSVTHRLASVHLYFNLEAGILLPLVLKGRLKHKKHFTYKSVDGQLAITFVCAGVLGTQVNEEEPFAKQGSWLQVFITDPMKKRMEEQFAELIAYIEDTDDANFLPKTYSWPDYNMTITIDDRPNS